MLSLQFIRENPEAVRKAIAEKNVTLDLDALLALDGEVRALKTRVDTLRADRNAISDGFKSAAPEERPALGARAKAIGARDRRDREMCSAGKQSELDALLLRVPNIPWEGAPVGPDESFNTVVRTEGTIPAFDFEPLDHVALIEKNDWADLARITQVAGSRTYCLKGRLAMLEQALMLWAQQRLAADGFTLMTVPALARPQAFVATGHFPGHEEEAYHMPADDLYLAGTGEIALTSLHSGEIIDADKLPILYAGYSPCFRREAGSAGRDVRGLLRVHQFYKLEQYVICRDDDGGEREVAPAPARQCRGHAAGAGDPLSGDRGLDRRHGQRQVPDERHRVLGAEPRQISRDAQLLDPARLAGAAGESALAGRGAEGPLRAHA